MHARAGAPACGGKTHRGALRSRRAVGISQSIRGGGCRDNGGLRLPSLWMQKGNCDGSSSWPDGNHIWPLSALFVSGSRYREYFRLFLVRHCVPGIE